MNRATAVVDTMPTAVATKRLRTATPVIYGPKWCHSAAPSEYGARFLNVANRSVNRKVEGSNPCSGSFVMSHDIVDCFSNLADQLKMDRADHQAKRLTMK